MNSIFKKFIFSEIAFSFLAIAAISQTSAANLSVTHKEDEGAGSLKAVLQTANALSGPHTIKFWCDNVDPSFQTDLPPIRKDITLLTPDNVQFGINKPLTGSASISKSGTGTLSLEETNSFSGRLNVLEGVLKLKKQNTYTGLTFIENARVEAYVNGCLSNTQIILGDQGILQAHNHLSLHNPLEVSGENSFIDTGVYNVEIYQELKGIGNLIKVGDGTLTFEIPNSYQGKFIVEQGKLIINSDNSRAQGIEIRNGQLILNDENGAGKGLIDIKAAELCFDSPIQLGNEIALHSDSSTINTSTRIIQTHKKIGGKGTLNKIGSGTLVLRASNTYEGGTNILEGSLRINEDGNLGASGAHLSINEATLEIADSLNIHRNRPVILNSEYSFIDTHEHDMTINAKIDGDGKLNKKGTGKLILAADSNKHAETIIHEGIVEVRNAKALGKKGITLKNASLTFSESTEVPSDIQIRLEDQNATIDVKDHNVLIHAPILGAGSFHKKGEGSLFLEGKNAFDGLTQVDEGTLVINSQANHVIVSSGATLKGGGEIQDLRSDGIISPGNSIGTLAIFGNFEQSASSKLEIEINPAGLSDKLLIGGTAALDGKVSIIPEHGSYNIGETYSFLTASGGVSGTFNTLEAPVQLVGSLIYNSHDVKYQIDNFISLASLVNKEDADALAAAKAIDQILAPAGSDMDNVVKELLRLSNDEEGVDSFQDVISLLQPAHYSAIGFAQQYNVILLRSNLFNRYQEFISFPCADKWDSKNDWEAWFNLAGDFNKQSTTDGYRGYMANSFAGMAGLDRQVSRRWRVGFAGAYSHTNVKWENAVSKGLINSFYGTMYGLYKLGRWYLEGALFGGYNHYHATRHIQFGSIDRNATHKNKGHTLAGELGVGYVFSHKDWKLQPFFNTDYIFTHQDSFSENGAGSLDLVVDAKNYAMVRTDLGINFSKCFKFAIGSVSPDIKLSYICEKQLKTPDYKVHYQDDSNVYYVSGMNPFRNLFSPGVGFKSIFLNDTLTFSTYYDAEIGSDFWDQKVNVRLGYSW